MKRISVIFFRAMVLLLLSTWAKEKAFSQVTLIYSHTFGTATSFPSGWTASGAQSTNLSVSTASGSSGYVLPSGNSASAGSNICDGATTSTIGTAVLTIDGVISTVGFSNIKVAFGARKTAAYTGTITFEWSNDGTTWNTITYTDVSNTAAWKAINSGAAIALPSGANNQANLRFRWTFVRTNTSGNYRIDDFTVYTGSVVAVTFTELVTPQYIAGNQSSGSTAGRTPIAICFQIDNLAATTTYNIRIGFTASGAASNATFLGNIWTGAAFNSASGNYISFTTNSSGSSGPVWAILQESANAGFNPGGQLVVRFIYSTSTTFGSTYIFQTAGIIKTLDAGITTTYSAGNTDDGAYLKISSSSDFSGKYILFYNNTSASGYPLYSYQFRTASASQNAQSELPTSISDIYTSTGGSTASIGDAPACIPIGANNSSGVQRIEIRNLDNTTFAYFTKSDGIWNDNTSNLNTTTIGRASLLTIPLLKGVYDDVGIYGSITEVGNMTVGGTLDITGTSGLTIGSNILTLNGTISSNSTLTGSSTSNVTVSGSSTSTVGTLNFASGARTLNNFVINRNANPATSLSSNLTTSNLTLTQGYLTIGSSNTLSIAGGGTISSSGGNLSSGNAAGTVNFNNTGTISGSAVSFYNLTINTGTITNSNSPTINNIFQINGGNLTQSPIYASGSTLLYNTSYGRYVEWGATGVGSIGVTAGYPYNVQISNNSTINYPNGSTASRAMAGSLTIDAGSSLYMNYGSPGTSNPLTVAGSATINGNLTLGDASGGDMNVGGDWTSGASSVIDFKQRLVNFTGSSLQNITTAKTSENFDYIGITSTGGVKIASGTTVNITASAGGNGLQMSGTGTLDLNGSTLTLGNGTYGSIQVANNAQTITSSSGTGVFAIKGGSVPTPVVFNAGGGSLNIASSVRTDLSGGFDFGSGLTTINGTLRMKGGSFVSNNAPIYANGSLLQYYANTVYNRTVEWGTTSGAGYPYNVQISNNTTLNPGGSSNTGIALNVAGNLTIDAGSALYMDYSGNNMTVPLTVNGDINIYGSLSASQDGGNTGNIILNGNWLNSGNFYNNNHTVTFGGSGTQTIGGSNSTTFYNLTNTNTTADVTQVADVTVSNVITLNTNTNHAINSSILTLNGTISGAGTFYGTTSSKLTIGGSSSSVGTLNFKAGGMLLNTLTMSRTSVTGTAALIGAGTDLSVNTLKLNNGILTLGNNLFSASTVNGSSPAASSWAANTTEAQLQQSFVALCDASGNPITTRDGSKGFRVTNLGTTETILPIAFDFNSTPNRMTLKNDASSTSDYYTVTMEKNDIQGTPLPMVNRIWYVSEGTTGGSNISMKLFFIKRNGGFGSTQDEVEDGFVWTDARLLHRVDDYPAGFANVSGGGTNGANDLSNFIGNTANTEVYAQYTFGNSGDNTSSQTANGIVDFSGIHKFSVANAGSIILPVTITNFNGYRQNNTVKLAWTSVNEINIDHYEIERSVNNISFVSIAKVYALNNGQLKINYTATDTRPNSGDNFYRIKVYDKAGKQSLSNTIRINFADNKTGIAFYPNPVHGYFMYGDFSNIAAGNYVLEVYNAAGKQVWQTKIQHAGGSWKYNINLPQSLAKGLYTVKISNQTVNLKANIIIE